MVKRKKEVILYCSISALMIALFFLSSIEIPETINDTQLKVILRDAGHHFLLSNRDSTSRILPIKELSNGLYEISFQADIQIIPDSLAKIFNASIAKSGLSLNYISEVVSCQTYEIVYSYQMSENQNNIIIPCADRTLPKSCYSILVYLSKEKPIKYSNIAIIIGLFSGIAALVYNYTIQRRKNKVQDEIIPKLPYLGAYLVNFEERLLIYQTTEIKMTEKECELLEMLLGRLNHVIPREELLHEIWESKGVIVGRSLDTYISKLRKKLSKDKNIQIINIHGIGYKLEYRLMNT